MSWSEIRGHDRVIAQFRRALRRGRLGSTFLFVGPAGIGKRTFAIQLARSLLCEQSLEDAFESCDRCPACQQVVAGTHPDLEIISRPSDKSFIPVELFIGDREHRMRSGLCHRISLKPFRGGRRIAIVDDADALNAEGANCLLKTLEEPPPRSVLILIATNLQRQLPTIRSRSQVVRFHPLEPQLVTEILVARRLVASAAEAERLAAVAGGSLESAMAQSDPQYAEFRQELWRDLAGCPWRTVAIAAAVQRFVEAAGKDAPVRRARLRWILQEAAEFFSLVAHLRSGTPQPESPAATAARAAARAWPGDAETAAHCVERCLDADEQLLSNANLSVLVECWMDDLGQLLATARARPA